MKSSGNLGTLNLFKGSQINKCKTEIKNDSIAIQDFGTTKGGRIWLTGNR